MSLLGNILAQVDAASANAALFWIFAIMSGASALGVVVSKNIVRMAVFLMFTLAGVAGLYFLLSAEFLAAVQLVVYVGGTLILIIFGVMLTSKSPFSRFAPKPGEIVIALAIGAVLMVSLVWGINRAIGAGVFASDAYSADNYPMIALGQALLGDFLVPFEVSSVLLLVVMIGAAYLAKARRREAEARGF